MQLIQIEMDGQDGILPGRVLNFWTDPSTDEYGSPHAGANYQTEICHRFCDSPREPKNKNRAAGFFVIGLRMTRRRTRTRTPTRMTRW